MTRARDANGRLLAATVLLALPAAGCGDGTQRVPEPSGDCRPVEAADGVLYGVWETAVTAPRSYDNPYDFEEIELQARFISPSGDTTPFFGFHDGDGDGGSQGEVWKLRWMPDETGRWRFAHWWSDGSGCEEGEFSVVDTGLPGPLRVSPTEPRYFETARGEPFHLRAYDLHLVAREMPTGSLLAELDSLETLVRRLVIDRGYNFLMVDGLIGRCRTDRNVWTESWWQGCDRPERFDPEAWAAFERLLSLAADAGVYVIPFAGMLSQGEEYAFDSFRKFLRYWVARLAPYYNFLGWNPTWEWNDIWTAADVDRAMRYAEEIEPFGILLTAHDCSHSRFEGWLGFSMRQAPARDIFGGNSHLAGEQKPGCDGEGGIGAPFRDAPILGSEDIWEINAGAKKHARDPDELRRGAWGILLAGVMPLYSGWSPTVLGGDGEGDGEIFIRRMLDFVYAETRYREYEQLNGLLSGSGRQIAAGIPGVEYLVYDEAEGSIHLDLSGEDADPAFSVLWFDPVSGARRTQTAMRGGAVRTFVSPFQGDAVLLLRR